MLVGVNYPWIVYAWDLGNAPPGYRKGSSSNPSWFSIVNADLQKLSKIGVRIVRWFIFGDGLTYESSKKATHKVTHQK